MAGTEDGPEAEEAMEIPGFPKPHNPGGFTGNLQAGTCCIGSLHVNDLAFAWSLKI